MTKHVEAKLPEIELASKEYVLMINTDTEKRIEKAFHDQTLYLNRRFEDADRKFETQNRWLIGLAIAIIASLVTLVITDFIQ